MVVQEGEYVPCQGLLFSLPHAAQLRAKMEAMTWSHEIEMEMAASRASLNIKRCENDCYKKSRLAQSELDACNKKDDKLWTGVGLGAGISAGMVLIGFLINFLL